MPVVRCGMVESHIDFALLDDEQPFELTTQIPHLFKHSNLGVADILEVWHSDPLFYPAHPPAHWLMVAEVSGSVLAVPLAPALSGDPTQCRPIGCYHASKYIRDRYLEDR